MFCIQCGKEISNEGKFCPFCGSALNGTATNGYVQSSQGNKSQKTVIIISVVSAVIIIGLISVLAVVSVQNSKHSGGEQQVASTSDAVKQDSGKAKSSSGNDSDVTKKTEQKATQETKSAQEKSSRKEVDSQKKETVKVDSSQEKESTKKKADTGKKESGTKKKETGKKQTEQKEESGEKADSSKTEGTKNSGTVSFDAKTYTRFLGKWTASDGMVTALIMPSNNGVDIEVFCFPFSGSNVTMYKMHGTIDGSGNVTYSSGKCISLKSDEDMVFDVQNNSCSGSVQFLNDSLCWFNDTNGTSEFFDEIVTDVPNEADYEIYSYFPHQKAG